MCKLREGVKKRTFNRKRLPHPTYGQLFMIFFVVLILDYDYMCSETDFQLLKQRIVVKKIEQGERLKTYEKLKTDGNMIQERRICSYCC